MASRPQTTIIIHTQGWTGRADVGAGGQSKPQVWRNAPTELTEAAAVVLKEGGPVGRRVWVLDSGLWLGLVELSAGAVANLSDADLAGPASYEAENAGGLSAAKAVTAVRRARVPEQDDQFLVAQCSRDRMAALKQAVKAAGGKLAGVGHPAGLPQALLDGGERDAEAGDWRRVEFWADEVVLAQRIGGRDQVLPLGMSPRAAWRAALSPLIREEPVAALEQTLIEPGVKPRDGAQWRDPLGGGATARWLNAGEDAADAAQDGPEVWRLEEQTAAEHFVAAWGERAAVDPMFATLPVPWAKPPKAPAARWPAVAVGVLALLLAAGAFGLQWVQATERVAELTEAIEHEQEQSKLLVDLEKKAADSAKAVQAKERAIEKLGGDLARALAEKARRDAPVLGEPDYRVPLADMMGSLSRLAGGDLLIESITPGSPRHEIAGIAASPKSASKLARELSRELAGEWSVSPAQVTPVLTAGDTHWRFTITLDPVTRVMAEEMP